MRKSSKKRHSLFALLCVACSLASAQAKSGLENYSLLDQHNSYVWMPVLHYQASSGVYAELRYNYEDIQTVSLFGGRAFEGGNNLSYTITPLVGFSAGNFSGVSAGFNADMEWKHIYLSSQTQYSSAINKTGTDFFYSWSEMGYSLSDRFYGGVALQYTLEQGSADSSPGLVAGINLNRIAVPFYIFRPFSTGRYFVLGLNYEFNMNKRSKK